MTMLPDPATEPLASPLVVWCDARFHADIRARLVEGARPHQVVFAHDAPPPNAPGFDNSRITREEPIPAAELSEADCAFGQPDPQAVLSAGKRLRWVHITSAGYTRYDKPAFWDGCRAGNVAFTNSSQVYDEPCAQHALAMLLAFARQLPQSLDAQRTDRAWNGSERRNASFLLNEQTVLMLGYGAIGRRLAALLAPFDMTLMAVRRKPTGKETADGLSEVVSEADLSRVLSLADHIVNLLPESDATRGYVSAERFTQMKSGTFFYNIGRGATVQQTALLAALESGHLGGAYLDVTDPEPLPADHPLWTAPNCFISPHSAGGHKGEQERLVDHFLRNLHAFARGEALMDQVV